MIIVVSLLTGFIAGMFFALVILSKLQYINVRLDYAYRKARTVVTDEITTSAPTYDDINLLNVKFKDHSDCA